MEKLILKVPGHLPGEVTSSWAHGRDFQDTGKRHDIRQSAPAGEMAHSGHISPSPRTAHRDHRTATADQTGAS